MQPDQIMGTVVRVGDDWHIRLLGEGGGLTPLEAPEDLLSSLTDGAMVEIDGYVSRTHQGGPAICHARSITIVAASPDEAVDDSIDKAWKDRIAEELKKSEPDWKVIEAASRAAVDNDPDAIRFSVDAAHIQRLGEQLVSKQETALSELIKNAYDADATSVTLRFSDQARAGGRLVIEDNGSGMTETVIRSSWMRISTNNKEDAPRSPVYNRVRAGRKGIGRFSVQRLGRRLRFTTKPAGETTGYRVEFNWDEAFKPGVSLADVFTRVERFDKPSEDQGTVLEILDLRDAWSPAAIERVWKAVVLLQSPFPLAKPTAEEAASDDPGFHVAINEVSRERQTELFSIEKSFLDKAVAEIEADIDDEGYAVVRLRSAKLDISDSEKSSIRFLLTGPVSLECRYFIFEPSLLGGMSQAMAASMGRDFGGVRIYRNGFRVQPYGEPSDDWLRLAFDTGRRNLLVPANNHNFFGHASITSQENPLFEETSSREGLIENDAFTELRAFTRWAVEWAALRIAAARKRKQRASERGFTSTRVKPSALLQDLLDRRPAPEERPNRPTGEEDDDRRRLAEAAQAAKDYEEELEAKIAASIEYEEMLRVLASLGLSIGVFGHEIKGAERAVVANLMILKGLILELPDDPIRTDLEIRHDELDQATGRLFDIGGYIGGLMSKTESRDVRDLSVKGAVDRFTRQFSDYMAKQRITFEVDVEPLELRTSPMHAAELDSVLLNFLTNSIKSMKRAKVEHRQVRIEGRKRGRLVAIAFEDNGIGVPADIRDRIFDPFFTTTLGAEDDGVAGPGTGLGLKIVSDIAEAYGGTATVGDPSEGYTCRMEFSVLAHEEEV